MAHPLNRPRFDAALRPRRRGLRHPAAARRRQPARAPTARGYARLFGGEPGIDPYTRAVSDVYQDLFGEGSFIGKGIYDVDAFERALDGRFPENRILSHDLLEGCYARSGLLSDVELYEEYPVALQRRRRAAGTAGSAATGRSRGWLLPRVPGVPDGAGAESAVGAVAVEDLRQPAPQPGAARADAAAAARLDGRCRPPGSGRWSSLGVHRSCRR